MANRMLILGGTSEAVALAKAISERFPDLVAVTSLAGVTARPAEVPGEVRTGGFGGAEGLAAYLCDTHITCLIDATHPFAARIAANAATACARTGTPRLKLVRPMWAKAPEDVWHEVDDGEAAAAKLADLGARSVFLTLGRRDLDAFAALDRVRFLVQMIETPEAPLPIDAEIVAGRGPFDAAAEAELMARHGIDALVTKASGGAATEGKILAARARRLPVVMIRRPALPPGETVASVAEALKWLERRRT